MCSQTQVKSLCFLVDFSFRFVFLQNSHIITIQNKRICRILINNIYFLKTSHVYVLFSSSSFRIYLDFFIFFPSMVSLFVCFFCPLFFFPFSSKKKVPRVCREEEKKGRSLPLSGVFWRGEERGMRRGAAKKKKVEGEEEGGEEEDVRSFGRSGGRGQRISLLRSLSLSAPPHHPPPPPQRRASLRPVMRKTPPACLVSGR